MLRDYVYLIDSMPTFNNLIAVICSVLHRTFCAVIRRGHYRISPKRGWARCNRNLIHKKLLFHFDFWLADNVMISNYAASTKPQNLCKISRPKLLGCVYLIGSMPNFNNLVALI